MDFRLLVPLDGSALSECAIAWSDVLAGALPARVDLLTVVPQVEMPELSSDDVYDYYGEQEVAAASRALARLRGRFTRATQIETDVVVGAPADMIIERARATSADLIVMATHNRGGLPRVLMGSVTGRVIRRSGTPVLAIRPDLLAPPQAPRRILVPLDGSELAAAVVPYACKMADTLKATLVLFTVADRGPMGPLLAKIESTAEAIGNQRIEVEVYHSDGDPGSAIAVFAAHSDCSLIAMSTHGRAGLGRWTVGSVTDWVIHYAPVPVMAIRPLQVPAAALSFAAHEPETPDARPVVVTFTDKQAQLARMAFEHLAWSATRHDHLAQEIRGALAALDTARESASEPTALSARR
ncbi:MAG TPA: universal stress protein [Chloroflexota bacterium]